MPKNKDAFARYKIIDAELRKWKPLKTSQLATICSNKLDKNIAERTIQKDIEDLKEDTILELYAPIKYNASKKAHYYDKGTPPIFPPIVLNEEDVNALIFYSKALSHYKNYAIFNDITQAIEKVLDGSNIPKILREALKTRPIFEAEKNIAIRGSEYIRDILIALIENKKIAFDYARFDGLSKQRKLTPFLLKEDKQMWYVIGNLEDKGSPTTFALDRMNNLVVTSEKFVPIEFDSENYFKHCYGITVPNEKEIKVTLSFTPEQGMYLKALKIHETQDTIIDTKKEFRISVKIKPTYEFYSKILSYGSDVKVISPSKVVKAIKDHLREALTQYEK